MKKPLIIIAIDFGTTYSGVAHTYIEDEGMEVDPQDVTIVVDWDGSDNTWDKVPTRFAYVTDTTEERPMKQARGEEDHKIDTTKKIKNFRWGFNVEPGDPAIEYIKLLLQKQNELPKHVRRDDIEKELRKQGKTVETAAGQYLASVKECIETALDVAYKRHLVHKTSRRIVLTVPAIWDDAAKAATRRIAFEAGFSHEVKLVSEPEAAAIWAFRKTPGLQPKVGDRFVVCDAGGGTVDLISYEITKLKPFMVKEAVPGSGGLCGGSFVNNRFEQRVRDKMGITAFDDFKKAHPDDWREAMNSFESWPKRNFNPLKFPKRSYNIRCHNVPDVAEADIKDSTITISTPELEAIYEPIIKDVIDLTAQQVKDVEVLGPVSAILLVGGFGQSIYLLERLNSHFASKKIEVLRPPSAWSAVARGAVLWGSEGGCLIQSRKARFWYGVRCRTVFEKDKHPLWSKTWDKLQEVWFADSRFSTFIKLGQTVEANNPISIPFTRDFKSTDDRIGTCWLYKSSHPTKPEDTTGQYTSVLCHLESDLRNVDKKYFEKRTTSKGVVYYTIHFNLKMELQSGGLKFALEVDGVEYSSVTAKFL